MGVQRTGGGGGSALAHGSTEAVDWTTLGKPWGCQWGSCRVRAGGRGGRESLSYSGGPVCSFVVSTSISAVSIT
jgi:hypothetical protein